MSSNPGIAPPQTVTQICGEVEKQNEKAAGDGLTDRVETRTANFTLDLVL